MARRERMDEDTLAALVGGQIEAAGKYQSELAPDRNDALRFLRGEAGIVPFETDKSGNPVRSTATSRDLSDVLGWIMPGVIRVFLASGNVVRYEPNKPPAEGEAPNAPEERADQATDYVNYVFLSECNGYRVLQSAFYDGFLFGNGIIKHYWDDYPEYRTEEFSGLSDDQYHYLLAHADVEEVLEHSEYPDQAASIHQMVVAQPAIAGEGPIGVDGSPASQLGALPDAGGQGPAPGDGISGPPREPGNAGAGLVNPGVVGQAPLLQVLLHDCKIKRRVSSGRLCVEGLPGHEFLIERGAKFLDEEVRFVAHHYRETRSSLVRKGYKRGVVDDLPTASTDVARDQEEIERDPRSAAFTQEIEGPDDATDLIDVWECYVLVDYDGDGIAERRRIVMAGTTANADGENILENEEWDDDLPFSDMVPDPIPHQWAGRSLYDDLYDVQRVKTALVRQTLDNLYMVNNPMNEVVANQVENMDALINRTLGGNVFVKGAGAITPLEVPFSADKSFTMLEYWDQQIEKRTGVSRSTMGMDPDALQNQTAEAVRDSRAASSTKVETYARNIAETGMKRLFRCLLRLITKHQDRARTIRLRGKWIEMSPSAWDGDMDVQINTGLGSGSRDRDLMLLQGVAQKQELVLLQMGGDNPIVGFKEYRDTLAKMAEVAGLKNSEQYFKEITDESLQQFAQAQQGKPDPKMAEAQAKMQLEQAKAAHDAQLKQAQAQADLQHKQQDMAAKAEFDRQKATADLQLGRDKAAAEIEAMRERHALELQLAREKAVQEAQLKMHELQLEAELKREEMQMNMQAQVHATNVNANIKEARPQ